MSTPGSYDPRQESGGVPREMQRLRAQTDVSWPEEVRLLRFLGLRDGLRVLDVGCGPGYVAAALGDDFPMAHITAVDSDADLLSLAARFVRDAHAERPGPAVEFVHADATQLPFPDACIDFAIARYVFQHLPAPEAVAREVGRVLKPGGRFAIIDVDAALWGLAEPTFPEVAPIYAKTGRAQAERGGDRLIGRQLHRILQAAGFANVHTDAFVYHSDDHGLAAFEPQLTPDRLEPLRARGIISNEEMEVARRAYERFLQSPRAFVMMIGLVASGVKPA